MSGQDGSTNNTSKSSQEITPATNLPIQQADNNLCIPQELKEQKAKVKALKGIA
jgi:hypothetical protein